MNRRHMMLTHVLLLGILLSGITFHWGVATAEQANDETSETAEILQSDENAPTEALPTTEPAPVIPTEIPPQPTPTFTPTATATQPPPPTPTPTATVLPTSTSSPAPTATVQPTATSVSTPSPTATATVTTPTPTATATVTPTPRSGFSAQSIVSGSGCTQTSASDIVETTAFVSFSCEGRTAPLFTFYSGTVAAPTTGWQYRVNGGTWVSTGSSLPTSGSIFLRSVPAFTIDLRPTSTVTPGSAGAVTVSVTCSSGCFGTTSYTVTLGATRVAATPAAADLQVACTPATVTVPSGQPQTINCVYSAKSTLGSRQITLSQITVQAPAGWAIASSVGTTAGTALTIRPNTTIAYSATSPVSYAFSYTLTPSCTATTTTQLLPLASTFAFGVTNTIAGASTSTSIARSSASSLTLSVKTSSVAWNRTVSFTDTTVNGSLTYRIVASGCSGWSVSVTAGSYVYSGPNNGTTIPASNLQLTTAGTPTAVAGTTTGVTRTTSTGSMATSQKILSASSGSGNGTYEQQLDVSLMIPGNARAGTYTSTITLTSAAAP